MGGPKDNKTTHSPLISCNLLVESNIPIYNTKKESLRTLLDFFNESTPCEYVSTLKLSTPVGDGPILENQHFVWDFHVERWLYLKFLCRCAFIHSTFRKVPCGKFAAMIRVTFLGTNRLFRRSSWVLTVMPTSWANVAIQLLHLVFGHATWKTHLTFCLGSEFLDVLGLLGTHWLDFRDFTMKEDSSLDSSYSSMVTHIT